MEMGVDTVVLSLALLGTAAYTAYLIEKRREEIRRTIEVIDLEDTGFWQELTALRDMVPARR